MIDEDVRHAIAEIVAYNWADEEADYMAHVPDERHIFHHLTLVQAWLEATATGQSVS